ncbi:hypothetical protein C8Q79DRAFT_317000 [Trametes meyenii]|nr:hypothetical protein C8Q79DRAFT_317000 [Trametes meyenii]
MLSQRGSIFQATLDFGVLELEGIQGDMPHSFVVAQFNPGQSPYWPSPSGRLVAGILATKPFWALRFDLYTRFECENDPHFLCAVSSRPSPQQVSNASLAIGPKRAYNPSAVWIGDYELVMSPLMITRLQTFFNDLCLHTAPAISMCGAQHQPIPYTMHQLDSKSLERLQPVARAHHEEMPNVWVAQRTGRLRTKPPIYTWSNGEADLCSSHTNGSSENDMDQSSTFTEPVDPLYMFGQLNNPRAYRFNFTEGDTFPFSDFPTPINDEIFKYIQICKDYRKLTIEVVIEWVRVTREAHHLGQLVKLSRPCIPLSNPPDLLKNDRIYRIAADDLSHVNLVRRNDTSGSTSEELVIQENDSRYSKVDSEEWPEYYMPPWSFLSMDELYPEVPLGCPRVVAFDTFGIILNRDMTIRDALTP